MNQSEVLCARQRTVNKCLQHQSLRRISTYGKSVWCMCLKCISYLWTICLRPLIGFPWAPHSQPLREGQLQVTPGRILRRKPRYTQRALVLQELLGRAGGQFGRPAGLPALHHWWFLLMVTGASL